MKNKNLEEIFIDCVNSNDIDKLSNFEKEARITEPEIWVNEFNEDEYKDNLNKIDIDNLENSKVIVAIQNGIIIGRSDISISLSLVDFEKTGYIDWIYVLKNKRGLGIGKKLFAGAEKYFKQKGVKEYYLFTAQNDQAQQFYHRQSELTFSKKEVAEKEIK